MILNELEKIEISRLREDHPVIEKVCAQLEKYEGDQAMQFYASLAEKLMKLDENIKDCSAKEFNRYMMVITQSKKILEGLELGQKLKDKLNGGVEEKVKNKEVQEETMSLSDRMAEKSSKSK